MTFLRSFCLLAAITLGVLASNASSGSAQNAAQTQSETQEQLASSVQSLGDKLADVEKQLDVQRPSQATLSQLSTQLTPLASQSQALVDRLQPRVGALKTRLDQLGAKPDKGESADISKERETLEKTFADNDGLLKRAKVLAVKAQQDGNYLAKRQRTLFTTSLFQRSTSILNPPLWLAVARETPGNIADLSREFHRWLDDLNSNLTGGKLLAFWAIVVAIIVLYWPLTWSARRFMAHETRIIEPSRWQEVLAAGWTALTVAGSMIAVMFAVVYVFSFIVAPNPRLMPFFSTLQWGIIRIALAAGLARGLLAPNRPKWRLVNVDDTTADKLIRIAVGIALIISVTRTIEATNDVINASFAFSVAIRGIGALLVALGLTAALVDLGDDPEAHNPDADQPSSASGAGPSPAVSTVQRRDTWGLIRGLCWTLILVITGAVLVGYIAFANFLVDQITLVAGVGAVLYLLVTLLDEASAIGFKANSRLSNRLVYTVGIRRETLDQLPVILSGGGRLLLFGLALLIVAAPWGMQSTDLAGNLTAAFFGFKIGDFTISLEGIVVAVLSFLLVLAATRAMQNWLEDRYLPTTRLDAGLRNSIKTSLGYLGFVTALAIAAGYLGLDFQKLAIVAGALSVGIGFGLQSIVNNFVSGLILLWERAVRVGDWVVVGSDQGYVRKINVRSTEIETFDRAAVIVPNSNLVSGVVKNLMRTDRVGRLTIEVSVHAIADPEKVRETLLAICSDNEAILALPAPQVRFINLTASAMTFDLFCYVADVESSMRTKSDLYFEICKQFRRNHFFDGPPPDPTAINILGLERLSDALRTSDARQDGIDHSRPRKAS